MAKFGFIGVGNMGGALARAVAKTAPAGEILLADASGDKLGEICAELGCAAADNKTLAETADYIFIGVKPQVAAALFDEITPFLAQRRTPCVLISMCAGVKISRIAELSGGFCPVIRIMPNTPVSVGAGAILYACSQAVSDDAEREFVSALSEAGIVRKTPENLIDAGCAITGCGPAYVEMFIDALADGGVACGLGRNASIEYAAQLMLGTAKLVLETGKHPGVLKDEVCSPAGSTIEGVRVLEKSAFRSAVTEAVIAAYERTKQLG